MTSGGLGPTDDDRTKEAVAAVLGRPLVRDEEILLKLKERFRKRGYEMPEVNAKQADVIEGATVLANRRGSAPGFLVEQGGKTVVLLPGVPHELKAMWDDAAAPLLARAAGAGLHRRILKVAAMPESVVETLVKPVYAALPDVPITILAAPGEVQLHFAARGAPEEAGALLDGIEAAFQTALGGRDLRARRRDARGRRRGPPARARGRRLRSRSPARAACSPGASRTSRARRTTSSARP